MSITEGAKQIKDEILHGIIRVPQPVPFLLQTASGMKVSGGGNCYACSFLAVAAHYGLLNGRDTQAVAQAMDLFKCTYQTGDYISQSDEGMEAALKSVGIGFERNELSPVEVDMFYQTALGILINWNWVTQLTERIREGWIAMASVAHNSARKTLLVDHSDHWVVIDGARTESTPLYQDGKWYASRGEKQIHIVDSSSAAPGGGLRWMSVVDFINYHGGAQMYFVRKAPDVQSGE